MSDSDSDNSTAEEPEYEVERVLYQSERNGKPIYLVKWVGYGDEQCTWEPAESFLTEATLTDWERQRDAHDYLDEEELAMVQARMNDFQASEARKEARAKRREALKRMSRQASNRSSSRTPKSESPDSLSTTKRPRRSSPPVIQPKAKRPRLSGSPTVKEEPSEAPGVLDAVPAERPRPPNPMLAKTGSAQVKSMQVRAKPPPITTTNPEKHYTPSAPLPLAQNDIVPHPLPAAEHGGANSQTNTGPQQSKTSAMPMLRPKQKTHSGPNTSAVTKQTGNVPSASIATNAEDAKAGKRFRSLRQKNQAVKLAGREPAPDISKLDLREPDAWSVSGSIEPASKIQDATPKHGPEGSPLFVPEDNETELLHVDNQQTLEEYSKRPNQSIHGDSPLLAMGSLPSIPTAPSAPEDPAANQDSSKSPRRNSLTERRPSSVRAKSRDSIPSAAAGVPAANEGPTKSPRRNSLTERRPSTIRAKSRDSMPSAAPITPYAERRPPVSRPRSNSANVLPAPRDDYAVLCSTAVDISAVQSRPVDGSLKLSSSKDSMTSRFDRMTARTTSLGQKINLDVFLRFQDHDVGIVTLVDLPGWLAGKLRGTAKDIGRHIPTIEFKHKWVMNAQQYSRFSLDHGTFSVQAQGDKRRAIEDLCKYLEENDLAAVWEYPQTRNSLVLILHSSRAPGWGDSGEEAVNESENALKFVVRNKLPGIYLENDRDDLPSASEQDTGLPITATQSTRPPLRTSITWHAGAWRQNPVELPALTTTSPMLANLGTDSVRSHVQSPVELSASKTTTPTTTLAKTGTGLVGSHVQSSVESPISAPRAATTTADEGASSAQDGASIGKTSPSGRPTDDPTAKPPAIERLAFPVSFDELFAEARAVKEWLHTHLNPRQVFIDSETDDWDEFREALTTKAAAILFHEEHKAYCDLPHFYKVLRSGYIFCYELPFSSPPPSRQLKDPRLDQRSPWPRLFPRGMVLCITEDTVIRHPQETSWVLEWFLLRIRLDPRMPSWRLALFPDITSWLLRRLKESRDGTPDEYVKIVKAINQLNLLSLEASWNMNKSRAILNPDEFAHARPWDQSSDLIQSPSALPVFGDWNSADFDDKAVKARDKTLVEWFVGWTAANAHLYRRFFVLDSTHSNETEPHSWHVCFREATSFVEDEKKKNEEEVKRGEKGENRA
ncbi:hypothetical protein AYO22_04529 [Fonsecaea multimorphosa]|nr:hypothetical protein AYO22_04529 [Fonsecaea multimorphosa]